MLKNCKNCGVNFEITAEDLAFYDKVSPVIAGVKYSVPEPTHCPDCRLQRRLAFRNERSLYYRNSSLSGKKIVSRYPSEVEFPVYDPLEWFSDAWNPKDFYLDLDLNKSFFEQFKELLKVVPRCSLSLSPDLDENSEFTNSASESKNCYMITQAEKNENCYFSRGITKSRSCSDCLRLYNCELCYDSIYLNNCYACYFSKNLDNCSNCLFSSRLRGCKDCFGCIGLVNKQYCIYNQQYTKEEYEKKLKDIQFTRSYIQQIKDHMLNFELSFPFRNLRQINCEASIGDNIENCKNAQYCYNSANLEDAKYCFEVTSGAKDCMDFSHWGDTTELCYEVSSVGYNVYNSAFLLECWQNVSNTYYSWYCVKNIKNCFGCVGLKNAEYCILNKQYTREEYENLVPQIIARMIKDGEWGEYFDPKMSDYPYQDSIVSDFFELNNLTNLRFRTQSVDKNSSYQGQAYPVPETISETTDSILNQILTCSKTGKPYKISKFELDFLKQIGMPISDLCHEERHSQRMKSLNPVKMFARNCDNCSILMYTTDNNPNHKVYCEQCYLTSVYA